VAQLTHARGVESGVVRNAGGSGCRVREGPRGTGTGEGAEAGRTGVSAGAERRRASDTRGTTTFGFLRGGPERQGCLWTRRLM
jgi:hypothetical protein